MNYWKRIQLENIDIIKSKILSYVETKTTLLDKRKFRGSFIPINHEELLDNVPELIEAFKPYNLTISFCGFYLMWNNLDAMPHIDFQHEDIVNNARVNIPVLNCENTFTVFYENAETRLLVLPTGMGYHPVINKDYYEVTRVEIIEPTILKVSSAHSVIMDEKQSPRITLTIGFEAGIDQLLEN